jgi:hypothetical protein
MNEACQSSSSTKDTTASGQPENRIKPSQPLQTIAVIGTALISYPVQKTPENRQRLESMTSLAQAMGDLSDGDALVIAELLARPHTLNTPSGTHYA